MDLFIDICCCSPSLSTLDDDALCIAADQRNLSLDLAIDPDSPCFIESIENSMYEYEGIDWSAVASSNELIPSSTSLEKKVFALVVDCDNESIPEISDALIKIAKPKPPPIRLRQAFVSHLASAADPKSPSAANVAMLLCSSPLAVGGSAFF